MISTEGLYWITGRGTAQSAHDNTHQVSALHYQVLTLVLYAAHSIHHELGQSCFIVARINDFRGYLIK